MLDGATQATRSTPSEKPRRASVVGSPGVAPDTSAPFTINPATPVKLGYIVQPPATTTAGAVMTPAIVVAVQDQFDNVVTSSTATVAIAILNNPGGGTLSGTPSVAASAGLATFGNLSINKSGTGYTLRATSGTLTAAPSAFLRRVKRTRVGRLVRRIAALGPELELASDAHLARRGRER